MVATNTSVAGSLGMFEDAGRLYFIYWEMRNNTTLGNMRCEEFIPNGTAVGSSFQETDISATVIPAIWRTGGANENLGSLSTNVNVYVSTAIPGSPEIFWWRYDDIPFASSTFWTWNGNASLCTVAGSVGSQYLIPQGNNSQSENVYTDGDFDVTLENDQVSPGKISFDFQAHTPLDASSPANKQGRLHYSLGGAAWVVATLSTAGPDAPSVVSGGDAAPTISANLLQGIVVGSSKFRAFWDAAADGFSSVGQEVELMLDVF